MRCAASLRQSFQIKFPDRAPAQMLRLLFPLCLGLAACSEMPVLDAPAPPPGPAPQIVPLAGLVAAMPAAGAVVTTDPTGLTARAAALRARAAALRAQTFTTPQTQPQPEAAQP